MTELVLKVIGSLAFLAAVAWIYGLTSRLQYLTDRADQTCDNSDQALAKVDALIERLWQIHDAGQDEPDPPDTAPIPKQPPTVPAAEAVTDWLAREVEEHKRQLDADEAEFWRNHPIPTKGTK